jgi:Cys-tRNA(Pro)/Cys-tRNA(Cys) deacylase
MSDGSYPKAAYPTKSPRTVDAAGAIQCPPVSEVNVLGPLDIHQYLLEHDVRHEIVRLPRAVASADHFAEVLRLSPSRCLTTRAFHASTAAGDVLVLVLAPADVEHDTTALMTVVADRVGEHLGVHTALVPAGAELVSRHTDYLAGHLAPLLLPDDVIVVATHEVAELESAIIYTATGDGGTALGIAARDLIAVSHALVLASTAAPIVLDSPPSRPTPRQARPAAPAINLDDDRVPTATPAMRGTAAAGQPTRSTDASAARPQMGPTASASATRQSRTAVATAS